MTRYANTAWTLRNYSRQVRSHATMTGTPICQVEAKLRRGFSLLEVLISFSILVPVGLVVIGLFPAAHAITQRGWALTTAQHLAETELEKARCQNFDNLAGETISL